MDPLLAAAVLFGTFAVLLALGVPISVGIIVSAFTTSLVLLPWTGTTFVIGQQMNMGVESFSLLAVPLFILAGNIMNNGGIAQRLVDLALVIAGRVPGSLAHTNVLANMLFGSLSGSAVASAAAIGIVAAFSSGEVLGPDERRARPGGRGASSESSRGSRSRRWVAVEP